MTHRTRRRLALATGLVLAGSLVAVYLIRRDRKSESAAYRTATIDRGEVVMTVTATGAVSAVTTVLVSSQVSGIIARLHADFNDQVGRGQLLAELDPTPFEAQVAQRKADLDQAEVQVRNAQLAFGRQERLLREGLTPESDYDVAEADHDAALARADQARAALQQAEANLGYTKIRSPIEGVVVDRQYDVGQTVAASFQAPTLFTIAQDLTRMQVQAAVDQSDIGRVQIGQTARFTVDAYPDEEFRGEIRQVRLNATANQNVITYPVILEVPNPEQKLRPQMTAYVSIEVDRIEDTLRVPNAALRFRPPEATSGGAGNGRPGGAGREEGADRRAARSVEDAGTPRGMARQLDGVLGGAEADGAQHTIYLLGDDGKLEPVRVRTGISDGRFTAILSGDVRPGAAVVVGLATVRSQQTGMPAPRGGRMF